MAGSTRGKPAQSQLAQEILEHGKLAFNPIVSEEDRWDDLLRFSELLDKHKPISLIRALNLLIQPTQALPWLQAPLMKTLVRLPLQPGGVQDTIEMVLSVHPGNKQQTIPIKGSQRSTMTHETLNTASQLLSSPPRNMSPDEWFAGIAPQLFELLEGKGEPDMDKVAAYVIGFGIFGRKQYGAPGAPGWKAFVDPILQCLDPSLAIEKTHESTEESGEEQVVIVDTKDVLVTSSQIVQALTRLTALLTSHPHPSLSRRILQPVLLPLWAIASWRSEVLEKKYRDLARRLLIILLQLSIRSTQKDVVPGNSYLFTVLQKITFTGKSNSAQPWIYALSNDGGIQIEKHPKSESRVFDLSNIEQRVTAFVNLLSHSPDLADQIPPLFLHLCHEWLDDLKESRRPATIILTEDSASPDDMEAKLVRTKVMQEMLTTYSEKLLSDSKQLLELVSNILSELKLTERKTDSDEEVVTLSLSLLNLVLTSSVLKRLPNVNSLLEKIQASLKVLSKLEELDVSRTAQNLLLLLEYRMTEEETTPPNNATDRLIEDRKTYELALSYLTSLDSPPPLRVQGLDLLSELIKAKSPTLDIPALLILFSTLLQDEEEYVYLRTIKAMVQLSSNHPKAVLRDLIDRYLDSQEEYTLDVRLRYGEALLQVIQNIHIAFTGETAMHICEGLLFIAGRRAHRPKTRQEQEKRAIAKKKPTKEPEGPADDEDPDSKFSPEDQALLAQIIGGWESKRGTEDIRIRSSALTILSIATESNISGIETQLLSSAVDLSIHILTLEPEPEKGILRRAAILLIMAFARSLNTARSEGKNLGFGFVGQSVEDIQRILRYVEESDGDGLVRRHARDVVESLEAWQMHSILPVKSEGLEIGELKGLALRPGSGDAAVGRVRPRIEEIE